MSENNPENKTVNTATQLLSNLSIIDTTYYSEGFPKEAWRNLIQRTNYIAQIEDGFANNINIFFIEGEEDSGKTILASQVVRKYVESTISVFFNPLNNLDYQNEYFCGNVVNQVKFLLGEAVSEVDKFIISTEQYRQSLYQLRKSIKRQRNKKINIVIDGLEAKLTDQKDFIGEVFSMLPFGEESFRIIITGNKNDFLLVYNQLRKQECKQISLTGFTEGEVANYLEMTDPGDSFRDLYKVTKGYPGRLRTLKRLIKSEGYSLDQISGNTNYTTWLELDCQSIDLESSRNNVILSILSLTDRAFTISDIAQICIISESEVEEAIQSIPILDLSEKVVNIISSAHKRYLANILRFKKNHVEELLIKFYAEHESLNSLIDLPTLYSNRKLWGKVIEILDDQYLNKILNRTGSLKLVTDILELGVQASENSNRYADLLRYSIQGSIVNELDNYLFWESEIEARISIRDFSGAISLAESAIVLVDRLRLLALIARRQKEFNNTVDNELTTLIRELYKAIDLSEAGEKIYDIVTHLIYALPNLAIEIIEKSSGNVSNKSINDWVVAKLSIAAIDSENKNRDQGNTSQKMEAIQKLNNPSFKKINRAISFLVGNFSAERVLEEVEKIADGEEKLKLLRLWLSKNRGNVVGIEDVIEAALNELVMTSSETTVSIEVLNELSSQLPHVRHEKAKEDLYKRFKSIERDISDFGLVKNKFIFKLNMFHTEYFLYSENATRSLNTIINDIDNVDDMLIKLEAYAETFAKLTILQGPFKEKISFIYSRILTLSKALYQTTASQFKISEHFLATIGKQNPRLALKIIEEMNNVDRRERSRMLVWESYLDNNLKFVHIDLLKEIEARLEIGESKMMLYIDILERFAEAKTLHHKVILQLLYFSQAIPAFSEPEYVLKGYVLTYKIISKDDSWKQKLSNKYEALIYGTWKGLESDWEKIDQGFNLCYELAQHNSELSRKVFSDSAAIKNSTWLDSRLVAYTYLNGIKLVIRSYYGLMNAGSNISSDMQLIEELINKVPSQINKLRLWTEMGFYAAAAVEDKVFRKVTNDHVIHIVHDLVTQKYNLEGAIDALTLIHILDSKLVDKYIKKIPQEMRELAYGKICDYYVTKRNPFEIYDQNAIKYNTNFTDLSKAINALEQIKTDSDLYFLLSHICDAIYAGFNKELSKPQVTMLTEELNTIAGQKFPDKKNIQHDGFKILAELKVAKASRHNTYPATFWESFSERANTIPNLSDMIVVKSILIEELPFDKVSNGNIIKRKLFDEIIEGLNNLPAHYEYVERVIDVSNNLFMVDKPTWKKCVDRAFNISASLKDGAEAYASQRKIIDSMFRLDPAYAKDLVKQVDKDNKQSKINKLLNKHLETLEVAEKIKNNKTIEQKKRENANAMVSSIYITLRGLNSDKVTPKKVAEVSTYLQLGNRLPLHEVFPVYMYYLNNCAKMYKSTKDGPAGNLQRENFKEAINAINLIQILSQKKKVNERTFRKSFIDEEFTSNKSFRPESREAAFNFIRAWLVEQADDFIYIADPDFGKDDLELMKILKEVGENIEIDVLGSRDAFIENAEEQYRKHWKTISDEDPPFANFTFVRTQDGKERAFEGKWIITKNGGLRLGTSFNNLGNKKSEISVMQPNEALKIKEETLNEYIQRKKKELNKQRLYYKGFSL